jgi:hypothetical protein
MEQPRFASARSIGNAIDRASPRMLSRPFALRDQTMPRRALETITAEDIPIGGVFAR